MIPNCCNFFILYNLEKIEYESYQLGKGLRSVWPLTNEWRERTFTCLTISTLILVYLPFNQV